MRILHSMIRVNDLEESIKFYTEVLGMNLLREKEYPEGKFSLAFLGYGKKLKRLLSNLLITGIKVNMSMEMHLAILPLRLMIYIKFVRR